MTAIATIAQLEDDLRACLREIELPESEARERIWLRRKKEIEAEIVKVRASLPPSHLEAINAAGFEVLGWQSVAVEAICTDGAIRSEWLPEDLIHWSARRFVRWRTDGTYAFSGWEPKTDQASGGRYRTVGHALSWFVWIDCQDTATSAERLE